MRKIILASLVAGALFLVGCQVPFTKKVVTLPLFEKSAAKLYELNKQKMAEVKSAHYLSESNLKTIAKTGTRTSETETNLTLSADSDLNAKKVQAALSGTIKAENASYDFGLEFRAIDQISYFRVTKLPSIPGLESAGLSDLLNTWYKIDPVELQQSLQNSFSGLTTMLPGGLTSGEPLPDSNLNINANINAVFDTKKQEEFFNKIVTLAQNANIYSLGERLKDEKIEGVNCYRYRITINRSELKKFILEIVKEAVSNIPGANEAMNPADLDKSIDEALNQLKDMAGEVWIGKKDYFTHKLALLLTMTQKDTVTSDVSMSTTMSKFNEPVIVEAPKDSKSVMELINSFLTMFFGLLGNSTGTVTDVSALADDGSNEATALRQDQQDNQISSLKEALALYRAVNSSYPDELNDLVTFFSPKCQSNGIGSFACDLNENLIVSDAFTGQPYPYQVTSTGYELTYSAELEAAGLYQKGSNTLTPDSRSLEISPQEEKDSDQDGLLDVLEEEYGTDAAKPDTDADGFQDGEELLNGYNPLGEGEEETETIGETTE